ncbi:integrin alpha, partial [Nostoc sp. WHI]|uniref:integrin alpha n=1 Tax=Nostoc sp. WHI TaxID=2650611 RepID=UPI0018C7E5F1
MANAVLNLSDLNGSNGFILNGIDSFDYSGGSVSSAGDINGDGFDDLIIGDGFNDLIIGANGADPNGENYAGESYVVFGSNSGFDAQLNLSDLNGSNGFVINGIDSYDYSGRSVSSAGDINGDGFDDLIIGAPSADPNGENYAGESYVVFGSNSGFDAQLNLSDLNGSNGFVINGIDSFDISGVSVSSAGDINGDGFDDLIIGAVNADPNGNNLAGESYVVFGSNSGFDAQLNLSDLNGSNGFVINGIDSFDISGVSVSSAGDVNGDGFDDLIIGAFRADPNGENYAGESYVVFGSNSGFDAQLNLSDLNGSNGFVINGIDS